MNVIICGGGTAGHIMPGIAIAETLIKKDNNTNILFISRTNGEENINITKRNFALKTLQISGLERKISINNIRTIRNLFKSVKSSKIIIKEFSPDIVVGTGGYVCYPVLRASQSMRIPTVIHESNSVPGLATKMLAGKCDKIFVNFADTRNEFKSAKNICVSGNPLLKDFKKTTKIEARKRLGISLTDFLVISFGGSGGAAFLNRTVMDMMSMLYKSNDRIKHVHATGKKYYDIAKEKYPKLAESNSNVKIVPFIYDMSDYMHSADLIICRSGAMTLSEAVYAATVPIMIPSPNVTNNHQYKNAKYIEELGGGILLSENSLTAEKLYSVIIALRQNQNELRRMQKKLNSINTIDSNELIYKEIIKIVSK